MNAHLATYIIIYQTLNHIVESMYVKQVIKRKVELIVILVELNKLTMNRQILAIAQ